MRTFLAVIASTFLVSSALAQSACETRGRRQGWKAALGGRQDRIRQEVQERRSVNRRR